MTEGMGEGKTTGNAEGEINEGCGFQQNVHPIFGHDIYWYSHPKDVFLITWCLQKLSTSGGCKTVSISVKYWWYTRYSLGAVISTRTQLGLEWQAHRC